MQLLSSLQVTIFELIILEFIPCFKAYTCKWFDDIVCFSLIHCLNNINLTLADFEKKLLKAIKHTSQKFTQTFELFVLLAH